MRKKIILPILMMTILGIFFTFVGLTHAQTPKEAACEGVGLVSGAGGNNCATPAGSPTVSGTIETVIDILSIIVGVAAVIMIIIGGFRYITSGGDSNSINGAKNTILYAIIGLVVVAIAQAVVAFVLNKV